MLRAWRRCRIPAISHVLATPPPVRLIFPGTDLSGDARSVRRAELIDHGVNRVFQLQDFTFIDGNFLRDRLWRRRSHFGDTPDSLAHEIDAVGQVFPSAGNGGWPVAELALGADPGHAQFRGERAS